MDEEIAVDATMSVLSIGRAALNRSVDRNPEQLGHWNWSDFFSAARVAGLTSMFVEQWRQVIVIMAFDV